MRWMRLTFLALVSVVLSHGQETKNKEQKTSHLRKLQRKDHDNISDEPSRWCETQYQSYDPTLSCSAYTIEASGTKCAPTTARITCEAYLMGVYLNFGENRAKLASRLQGCTCAYVPWTSVNGLAKYRVDLIAQSSYSGFEGPLVVGTDLFWSAHEIGIMRRDGSDNISVYVAATDTFVPSGLAIDLSTQPNTLVVTSSEMTGKGAVYRVETDRTLTSLTEGVPLNAPNDLVVRSDGTVYFTDPLWRLQQSAVADAMGVYSITFNGKGDPTVTRQFTFQAALAQPNGIALAADETELYVSLTGTSQVVVFDVNADDGSLDNVRQFDEARVGGVQYLPDGMTIHDDTLYVSTNMDYIAAIELNSAGDTTAEEKNTYSIDLFDAGIYGVSNLAFDVDGSIYMTQRYPGVRGDKIFKLTPRSNLQNNNNLLRSVNATTTATMTIKRRYSNDYTSTNDTST